MKASFFLVGLLIWAQFVFARPSETETSPMLSQLSKQALSSYARANHFNGTILVQQKGKTFYGRSFGMANVPFAVPNTNATKYRIASIIKLFTPVLIMQLQEEKKLDLNQPIRAYLPSYKGEGAEKVTIFNLLTAT